MGDSHAGRLLVATPAITDPNFYRTVVLMCAHDENGAFGLVLNRPIDDAGVTDHLPRWGEHVSSPPVLFKGGPVEPNAGFALGLARSDHPGEGWVTVFPHVGLLDLNADPDQWSGELRSCRVFTGYAGWGAGQLEGEIKDGGWFIVDAAADDAFSPDPATLWRNVLRRQGGELRLFAHFPADPRLN